MFGNNKPFGSTSAFGTSTFGTTSTPFGQSAGATTFGAKPTTGNVFGASTFGAAAPAAGGLFGSTAPTTTGLFGQTSTAFGQPASTSGGSFAFGGTSTSGGLFGTTTPATQSSGLFGGSNTSAFGAPRTGFGGFGTGTTTGTSLFGQTAGTGAGLFGTSTGFGAAPTSGTTVKFNPPTGSDTMMKGGVTQNINTRHQCITCMKEYENKSLEELRLEDYSANRKGPQAGMGTFGAQPGQATGGLFSTPAASTSAFSFGTTQSKPLFGTTTGTNTFGGTGTSLFGQTQQPTQNTGIFGKPVGFGTATTSAAPSFSFGNTTGSSLFGQNNQQKPLFGQQTGGAGLFGQTTTAQPTTGFGTGTAFGGFGATAQPTTGLFGAKPTGFGTTSTATTNTFSFGNPTANAGGLFGQKPATSAFGTSTGFGTGTGFGSFGTTQTGNTGLFGQTKPAGTGFGTTNTGFGSTFGTGFGASPFTSMGMNTSTGTGLFGSTLTNKQPGFNFTGTSTTGFGGFGQTSGLGSNFNFGVNPAAVQGTDPNAVNLQQQLQAQQVFAFTANPFGDNPLFRNNVKDSKRREELLKPTNPAAQKAVLTNNLYKVSPAPAAKIKPKPLTPISCGKVSLFDGLEDEEPSLSNSSFVPKRSIKKLVMKSQPNSPSFTVTSSITSTVNKPTEINLSTSIHIQKSPLQEVNSVGDSSPQPLTFDILGPSPLTHSVEEPASGESLNSPILDSSFARHPLPDIAEKTNPELDFNDTIEALHTKASKGSSKTASLSSDLNLKSKDQESCLTPTSSLLSDTDYEDSLPVSSKESHSTGVRLTKAGYYTIPSLDDILAMKDENGNILVTNFIVGRKGYGEVRFLEETNVANLNLDEIISFRRKEVIVYPDDENKPPVGEGLNRKAEITLECVWPTDKTTHLPISEPVRLSLMGYEDKIVKATARLGAKFIDYIPETGSWIFQVDHFSKYGLEDSDDECEDPKQVQAKGKAIESAKKLPERIPEKQVSTSHVSQMAKKLRSSTLDDDDEMPDADVVSPNGVFSPLQQLVTAGVDSEIIQGMKASFFVEEAEDSWDADDVEMQEPIPRFSSLTGNRNFVKPVPIKKRVVEFMESDSYKKPYSFSKELQPSALHALATSAREAVPSPKTAPIPILQQELWSSFPVLSSGVTPQPPSVPDKSVVTAMHKVTLRPYKEGMASIYGHEKSSADMGYFMGHSFRVGWAPGFQLLHLGQVGSGAEVNAGKANCSVFKNFSIGRKNSYLNYSPFAVSISKVKILSQVDTDEEVTKNLIQSLEVHLNMSLSASEEEAPIFVPKPGVDILDAHADLSERHLLDVDPSHGDRPFIQQCSDVWELCVALWGEIPGLELDRNQSMYAQQMIRREALSNWLIKTTGEEVLSEINNNRDYDTSSYLSTIFSHLTGRQIDKAVSLAQESHDHCLATLIAQAEASAYVRRLIHKQITNWEESSAYEHINPRRLKLYVLLAGELVWTGVNCCDAIRWRRILGLHLWFYCFPTSSINDAVIEYEKNFLVRKYKEHEAFFMESDSVPYAQPPFPPYVQSDGYIKQGEFGPPIYDTCFHLLKLYCDRSYRLDKLVMPETYSSSHNDYRLSWLLHMSLFAIGYQHLPYNSVTCLHLKFAAQLEAMDLWHWAVFVLLHLSSACMRKEYVKDLLLRHLSLDHSDENDERELFLQEKLHVPSEWIYQAKAIKAHSFGRAADEALYLLKAGSWSKSHNIVITQLASDAVINENYDYLLGFLRELAPKEKSDTILDWASGGQVYLDYIHISQMVESIIKGEISACDIVKLQPEVVSLCHRLSSINCPSAKDRLCQSEMAKKTATLLRTVFTLQASQKGKPLESYSLAPHIKSLPMPEDYALQELRAMAQNYLVAISAE